MQFCKKCGNKLDNDAEFCPKCGTPVSETKSSKQNVEETIDDFKTQLRGKSQTYGVLNLENLPEGHIIDDRYEIKEKVGQGGFGAVYRVFDKKMSIDKALKIIPEALVSDEEAMADLQSEARTMISLNHNSIVRVYDFHDTGAVKYIDMEFVEGKTLTKFKIEHPNKQVPETKVKELAIKIADGLAYAHSKGIIHKDIKPQNVMLTKDDDIKIMDFGIAETVRTSMSRIQNSSSSGTLVYMSPEQIKGKDVGKRSDIYSFGAMLYELLSGHPPFYKGDINYQILNEQPEQLKNVSDQMNDVILKCLVKDNKKRPNNFKIFITMLNRKKKISQKEDRVGNHKLLSKKPKEKVPFYEDRSAKKRIGENRQRFKSVYFGCSIAFFLVFSFISLIDHVDVVYGRDYPGNPEYDTPIVIFSILLFLICISALIVGKFNIFYSMNKKRISNIQKFYFIISLALFFIILILKKMHG